jgi:hypothetical protein
MRDRRACERRVYRLAALLSGNPIAAAQVIQAVLDAQPNLRELDSTRMDRLTVLRSREISPGMIVDERVPAYVAKALAELTAQQREAWVFVHVYKVPVREAARAMDCSVTAITTHLAQASERMGHAVAATGDRPGVTQDDAAARLREWAISIDVPAFFRREQTRRRRFRVLLVAAGVLVAIAAVVVIVLLVQAWASAAGAH